MPKTIEILQAPCGRGKTHIFGVPYMLQNSTEKFLYVAPLLDILDDVEKQIRETGPQPLFTFSRIDSQNRRDSVALDIERKLSGVDIKSRIIGVTHYSLWHLKPEHVAGRTIIIDESPPWLDVIGEGSKMWQMLTRDNLIEESDGVVRVTELGQKWTKDKHKGHMSKAISESLALLGRSTTCRLSPEFVSQVLDDDMLAAANRVILMAAMPTAGYLPEWAHIHGFELRYMDQAEHGLDVTSHQCKNTEIFYAFESGRFSSKVKLKGEWNKPLARLPKDAMYGGGSLDHNRDEKPEYVAAINVANKGSLGVNLSKKRILSPTIRGVNEFSHCDIMLWMAAVQPDPTEVRLVRLMCPIRTAKEIVESRHGEALYQFVMRGKLRDEEHGGNLAAVKILVPSLGDAEFLAGILGTDKVAKCSNTPKAKKKKQQAP